MLGASDLKKANVSKGVCYLQFEPEHEELIDQALRYELANSHWIRRNSNWDGVVKLYNKKYRSFPVGLIERVEAIEGCIQLRYLDRLQPISVPEKSFFELPEVEPRPYQVQAVEKAVEKGMGIINIATGGGKTLIGCEVIRRLGVKAIVFVPNKTLLGQWKRKMEKFFGVEIGVIGAGQKKVREITVCTVQSAKPELVKDFNTAIFDETHRLGAGKWRRVGRMCNARYRFGLSATALLREDNANLEIVGICGDILQVVKAKTLQDQGFLVPCRIEFVDVFSEKKRFLDYQDAYRVHIVENEDRNNAVLSEVMRLAGSGRKVLVLVDRVEHGRVFERMGFEFVHGQSSLDERRKAVEDLNAGLIRVLVATKVFGEGVDIPAVDAIVVASPAASVIKVVQRVGRGLRLSLGKSELVVVDFFDHVQFFDRQARKRRLVYEAEGFEVVLR